MVEVMVVRFEFLTVAMASMTVSPVWYVYGALPLNAAFFVANRLENFQRTLTTLAERHEVNGLRFRCTGPWPPYHFVGNGTRAALASPATTTRLVESRVGQQGSDLKRRDHFRG